MYQYTEPNVPSYFAFYLNSNYSNQFTYQEDVKRQIYSLLIKPTSNLNVKFNYIDWIELEVLHEADIQTYLNKYLHNNLSLLFINDNVSYAFISRLIEYLSNNVISHTNQFGKNIITIQNQLKQPTTRYEKDIKIDATWNDYMRIQAFEFANNYKDEINQLACRDINGFIDKDTEAALPKYKAILNSKD